MPDNTSVGDTGVTPQSPTTPVTGTPAAPASVTQQTAALTSEEMAKRVADLERSLSNAKEENDRHSKRLSTYEKQEKERLAAKQAAEDAERTELDRVKKQAEAAQQQIQQYKQQLVMAQVKLAAKDKGIIDPDLAALAIQSTLEYGEDGLPTNLDKALENLIKSKPYLVPAPPAEPATTPASTVPTPTAPAVPAMHPSRAGRSDIPSAGSNSSGRRYNLTDRDIWTAPGTPSKWQP